MLKDMWRERTSYLFLAPILVVYTVFSIWPIIQTFRLSFYDSKIVRDGPFVGLANYQSVLSNIGFRQAFTNTILFTVFSIVFTLAVSIVLAVLVNSPTVRFKTFFKIVYFLPVVTSAVAVGYVWKWMMNPTFGIINTFLGLFGVAGPNWLSNKDLALVSLIIVNVWKWIGYFMVILLANLQLISPEYYEAAAIDGASPLQQFQQITLPLLRVAIGLCVVLGIVNFLRGFALVFVMTQGGPAGRTELIATLVYKEAFGTGLMRIGFSAAASMLLFALIMVFTVISNRMSVKEV